MKTFLFTLICCWMFTATFAQDAAIPRGSGSVADPFRISNLSELYWVSVNPDSWNKAFIQTADIDALQSKDWNNGEGWIPIGWSLAFTGSYDGAGFKIANLSIKRSLNFNNGFFGNVQGGILKNIQLQDAKFNLLNSDNEWNVGLIVGLLEDSEFLNCLATGEISIEGKKSQQIIGSTK